MNEWDWMRVNNNCNPQMRVNDIYNTYTRANDISIYIFSRLNKKWMRNEWEMNEKWMRNEWEMNEKWKRNEREMKEKWMRNEWEWMGEYHFWPSMSDKAHSCFPFMKTHWTIFSITMSFW